ncbi:hypothetical protein Shyhy02_11950 [Streptomyces hygroscopicus subsp. hygroscopicus]|nr:hypothetical protein Shyhy02_11950 [Streptomyces hygroscopicus subsp. hygroscopicus]
MRGASEPGQGAPGRARARRARVKVRRAWSTADAVSGANPPRPHPGRASADAGGTRRPRDVPGTRRTVVAGRPETDSAQWASAEGVRVRAVSASAAQQTWPSGRMRKSAGPGP